MKYYVQFLTMSSGQAYDEEAKSLVPAEKFPIDALGSDAIAVLDGRLSTGKLVYEAGKIFNQRKEAANFIGFKVIKGETFSVYNKVLYNSLD